MIKRIIIIFTTLLVLNYQQGCSQNWLPLNNGLGCDTVPNSLAYDILADNEENKIYLSGNFVYTANNEYENCESETSGAVLWDGERFINLSGGRLFQQGFKTIKYKDKIYASVPISFEGVVDTHLVRWNGTKWDSLPGAPDSRVRTSKIINDTLWLGGWFDQCAGQNSPMLAKFDGVNFSPLNNEFMLGDDNYIAAMDFLNDTLYVGGDFRNWGNNAEDSISTLAKFYNNRLYGVKPYLASVSGINYDCLVNYKNNLYLGGYLQLLGEDTIKYFLKYDGKNFSKVGPDDMQMNQQPVCMKIYNNELYILGTFNKLGDQEAQSLVKWDGEKYTILNFDTIKSRNGYTPINSANSVTSFDILNDTLYMAGGFFTINRDTMRCIAKLNRALSDPIPPPAENSLTLYPNPSSNEVTIGYSLNSLQNVDFGIYDIRGRLVRKIEKGKKQAGKYILEVDISNLANGIYIVQMQTGDDAIFKKLLKE